MGAYPGLKTAAGAEIVAGNCPRAFPLRKGEPAFEYFAGWFSGAGFYLLAAGMTGKTHIVSFQF